MSLQQFPGLIDVHTHVREPGAVHKEDFTTATRAALKGGFTFIIDMPNNVVPIFSSELLNQKISLAKIKKKCDVGFHFGTDGKNIDTFKDIGNRPEVFGLKIYANHTTGNLLIEDTALLENIFKTWEFKKPILVHAEDDKLEYMLILAKRYDRNLHVCHVASKNSVTLIKKAKNNGQSVTAGVCPHHLFLTIDSIVKLDSYALMKPPLGTVEDQTSLWEGINDGTIDIIETDHAPHTKEEKKQTPPPFGVPGLETTWGLMCFAVQKNKITMKRLIDLMHKNPQAIFNVPRQPDTYFECDPEKPYMIGEDGYETKCGWSPFEGWQGYGKVETVFLRGQIMVRDGKIIK